MKAEVYNQWKNDIFADKRLPLLRVHVLLRRFFESISLDEHVPSPTLCRLDVELAQTWCRGNGEDELAKMLSARAAEKAALAFYERMGLDVVDVASRQLTHRDDNRWRLYDLEVEGMGVDVKNARCSPQRSDRYVEHCIPKWKSQRNGMDIEIAGVLSSVLSCDQLLSRSEQMLTTVLGHVTRSQLRSLSKTFSESTLLEIDLSRAEENADFLPPWLFSFRREWYGARETLLSEIPRSKWDLQGETWRQAGFSKAALGIAIGKHITANQDRMVLLLHDAVSGQDLSLPKIYLATLCGCLEALTVSSSPLVELSRIRDLLFVGNIDFDFFAWRGQWPCDWPLLTYDPQNTVASLLRSMSILAASRTFSEMKLDSYRLAGPNILRGRAKADRRWITLVAYCGGSSGMSKCGYNPLVLGEAKLCACTRLICPRCGYCSPGCKQPARLVDG